MEIIDEIIELCKKKSLNKNEIEFIKSLFNKKTIDPNYNEGYFLMACSINGNYDMLNILKYYDCKININDNEALRICAQNNFLDCALLLFDNTVNIEQYDYSSSYLNLKKIKLLYNNI